MLMTASEALAAQITVEDLSLGKIYPDVDDIRVVSKNIAVEGMYCTYSRMKQNFHLRCHRHRHRHLRFTLISFSFHFRFIFVSSSFHQRDLNLRLHIDIFLTDIFPPVVELCFPLKKNAPSITFSLIMPPLSTYTIRSQVIMQARAEGKMKNQELKNMSKEELTDYVDSEMYSPSYATLVYREPGIGE